LLPLHTGHLWHGLRVRVNPRGAVRVEVIHGTFLV